MSIAPFPCEQKKRSLTCPVLFGISSKHSDTIESFRLDNYKFIGIVLGLLFILSLKKQNLSGSFYTYKVRSHFDHPELE